MFSKFKKWDGPAAFAASAILGLAGFAGWGIWSVTGSATKPVTKAQISTAVTKTIKAPASGAETVYIRNLAPSFISDKEIKRSIPAWEAAVNVDFAHYWHSAHYKLVFIGRKQAPHNGITAEFINKGPIANALAYHWTEKNNAPSITVYAGTGKYYGYSNSVSFTHELEELAGDPLTSYLNIGYPAGFYWVEKPTTNLEVGFNTAIGWFSEVSDPVEADAYNRPGADGKAVKISDFVTPAWFNDGVGSRFDFMGLCQQPYWIRPGGYAQYLDSLGWHVIYNFRKHHITDSGFYVADPKGSDARK